MATGSLWSEAKPTLNTSDDGTKSLFSPLTRRAPGREFALPGEDEDSELSLSLHPDNTSTWASTCLPSLWTFLDP